MLLPLIFLFTELIILKKQIKTAEILCVGTELLIGDIINTNAAYLSRALAALGISVYHQTVVGDNEGRMLDAIALAYSRCDLLLITGGLGPTCDDITRETTAKFFSMPLELHPEIAESIKAYFTSTGRKMTDNNLRQAYVPRGASVIPNDRGTAPGILIEKADDGKAVVLMPGVPSEMVNMFEKEVTPYLLSLRDSTLLSRNIQLFGIGESAAEDILRPLMESGTNPTVAPYAKEGEVRIRVSAMAHDEDEAKKMCDEMIEKIRLTEVGKYIYGIDTGSLEASLVAALRERGLTFACAESCTGGLIAKRIVDLAGVSDVFIGGAVTYANSAKEALLGVRRETLEAYGAVSEQTAAEMAKGIRLALGADVAVSVTGVAGPTGGSAEKPVGTVYVGVSTKHGENVKRLALSSKRDRDYLRYVSASNALHLALCELAKFDN